MLTHSARKNAIRACFLAALVLLAALSSTTTAVASRADIEARRAEARQILGQLQTMDADLEQAVEAYNGATYRLGQLQAELTAAERHLAIARRSNARAQRYLEERLVALYENGNQDLLEIMLGASSLDDLLNRLDAAKRVSGQDAQILTQVIDARRAVAREQHRIALAVSEQERVVASRAAERATIETKIAERQAYYDSVKKQIAELVAQERERERRLAEEARRRAEAQRQAQRELAAAAAAAGVRIPAVAPSGLPEISTPQGIGTAPPSELGAQAAQIALRYLGVPYVWAGASPSTGFDCSGLTLYVYAQLGVSLPHLAAAQYGLGVPVSRDQLQPGDLVFFHGLGHMGIYIGNDQFIHAPHTGDVVKISSLSDPWYASGWVGARRIA